MDASDTPVRRRPVAQDLQAELSQLFSDQARNLTDAELEEVSFDGRLVADESQVLCIKGFELPTEIWRAVEEPMSCDPFTFDCSLSSRVRAIFTGSAESTPWVSF